MNIVPTQTFDTIPRWSTNFSRPSSRDTSESRKPSHESYLNRQLKTGTPLNTNHHPPVKMATTTEVKQPAYSTAALNISVPAVSPESTPPSSHSASSQSETVYLQRMRLVSRLRLLITLLILGTSTAILGLQGHSLSFYNSTNLDPTIYHLPLWPQSVDLRPTISGIAICSTITALACLYLLTSLIPFVSQPRLPSTLLLLLTLYSSAAPAPSSKPLSSPSSPLLPSSPLSPSAS